MKRLIMKSRVNAANFEKFNEGIARLPAWHYQIIHVVCLLAVLGDNGLHHAVLSGPILKIPVIITPNSLAERLDALPTLQLGEQESRQQIRRKIAGAKIDPGIFIHFAAMETNAISSFFTDDFGPFDE